MGKMRLPVENRDTTLAERAALGVAARKIRPRGSIAEFTTSATRPDPVALLASQEEIRVPSLLPIRHERMAVSAFTFYRGSAIVMASDLGSMPNSGIVTQLCGDAHLSNFGLFAAPDRTVVFDINDFDETNPGPFEWDMQRLATSFVLAGRDNGLTAKVQQAAVTTLSAGYREAMARYAGMTELDIWYDRISIDVMEQWARKAGDAKARKGVVTAGAAARARDAWSAISKLTEVVEGRRRFKQQPPLLARIPMTEQAGILLESVIEEYRNSLAPDRRQLLRRYRSIDIGHKVVGVGSVGLLAFVVLMQGRDDNDLLVLQAKQAVASVLEPFTEPSVFERSGERVVVGQQLMQAASDSFLGWVRGPAGRDYYVRQLRDMKFSVDPAALDERSLVSYARLCGRTLARAHARSGDAVKIAAYLGTSDRFDVAMRDFAVTYADQVERDYATYQAAIAEGRVAVAAADAGSHLRIITTPEGQVSVS